MKDVAVGLGGIAMSGVHDAATAAAETATLGKYHSGGYRIPQILEGLPGAIAKDYQSRYGPALTGHPGELGRQLYEHPLSYILDVLGAGAVAGKAAEGTGLAGALTNRAGISAKALVEASEPATAAKLAMTDKLVRAGTSAATSEAAGLRAGLDTLVATGELPEGSIVRRLLPSSTFRAVGDKLVPAAESRNPATRLALAPIRKAMSEPLTRVEAQAATKDAEIQALLAREMEPSGQLRADASLLNSIATRARDAGLTRIEKPFFREKVNPWRGASNELAQLGGQHLMAREARAASYRAPLIQAIKEDPAVADNFHITATGLDIDVPGFSPMDWTMRRGLGGRELAQAEMPSSASSLGEYSRPVSGSVSTSKGASLGLSTQPTSGVQTSTLPSNLSPESLSTWPTRLTYLVRESEATATGAPFHPHSNLDELVAAAPQMADELNSILATTFGPDHIVPARAKDAGRAAEKLATKPYGAQSLRDAAAARVLVDDLEVIPQVLEQLKELSGGHFAAPIEDNLTASIKGGFRGVETLIHLPSGGVGEVQILTRRAAQIASEGHGLYEELRTLRATATRGQASVEQKLALDRLDRQMQDQWAPEREAIHKATHPLTGDAMDEGELAAANAADPVFTQHTQAVRAPISTLVEQFETQRQTLADNGWNVDDEIDMARRLNRGLADGLRRRTATTRGEVLPAGVAAQDELRVIDVEQFADLFDSRARTPSDILNRAYFPMRLRYGAHFQDGELVGGPSVAELDDLLHDVGIPQPIYFPYIDAERAKASSYFRSMQLRGANIYAKDPHAKQLRGVLLREGTYITDPLEAYPRRAATATREIETYRTHSHMMKTFGRLVTNAEDIPHGYVPMSADVLFLQHRSRLEMLDQMDELRSQGIDTDAALAEVTRRVTLRNQHDVEVALAGKAKIYAVPEHVAKQMQRASDYARVFAGPSVRLYWDQPIKLWRSLVLTASPRWIVNNVLGNSIFAAMQGVKTADVVRLLSERMRALLAGWLESKGGARQAFGEFLGGGELRPGTLAGDIRQLPGHADVGSGFVGTATEQYQPRLGAQAEDTTVGRAIGAYRSTKVGQRIAGWGGAVRHLNSEIESGFRDASFLTAIEKQQGKAAITRTARSFWSSKRRMEAIMRSGFDEARARLAVSEVNHFYGNYAKSTPFERHIVKRFIFPFWGFYRHQLKLILSFPWEYPEKARLVQSINEVEKDLMDQYGPVPDWLQGAIPLGPPGSEVSFLTSRGADPFSGTFQSPASMLSPPVKLALEQALGRSLFTGQEFTDENVVQPFGSSMKFRGDTGEPVSHVAPSFLESFLQTVPQYQTAKAIAAGGKTYDTASLIDILRGHGTIREPGTGAPKYPTSAAEQLSKLLGFPTTTYDLGGYQAFLLSQQQAAMREAAKRQQAVSF